MTIDKDKPSTWVKYKGSLCRNCIGTCCTMPVEVTLKDLIRLGKVTEDDNSTNRPKLVSRLKKQGLITSYREATGKFMLASRPNGECLFLDEKTRLCSVYFQRPDLCRDFPISTGNRTGYCPAIKKITAAH